MGDVPVYSTQCKRSRQRRVYPGLQMSLIVHGQPPAGRKITDTGNASALLLSVILVDIGRAIGDTELIDKLVEITAPLGFDPRLDADEEPG